MKIVKTVIGLLGGSVRLVKRNAGTILLFCGSVIVSIITFFLTGNVESEKQSLRLVTTVTAQLLGFSGIILGFMYSSLHTETEDIHKRLKELADERKTSKDVREDIELDGNVLVDQMMKLVVAFTSSLKRLMVAAIAFGVALLVELLHVKVFGADIPLMTPTVSSAISGIEFFLLAFGVGMLVRCLTSGIRAIIS